MDVQDISTAGYHAMHKIGQCSWPIWRVDDFTNCFQRDYLKQLFPLIAVGLSLLFIIQNTIKSKLGQKKKNGHYEQISNGNGNVFGVPGHQGAESDTESDEEDEGLAIGAGRLALAKKSTNTSIAVADRPKGQYVWVIVEELALLGLIACSATAFAAHAYGKHGQMTALVQTLIWTYIFVLVTLRLTLSNTKYRVPRLWNHTAMLYTIMWCLSIISFRSVLIHPRSKMTEVLIIMDFALNSLLFGIAISTRKGNKVVVMEWENGIEPSHEPIASLFSIATFSWVDNIVWKGYHKTLEIAEVWNLAPKDKCEAVLQKYRELPKTFKLAWHLLYFFRGKLVAQCAYAFFSAWFTFVPTLLLKAILEYIENPGDTPRNVVWLYVILLAVADIVKTLLDQQALWIGRKVCIQLRAIIIGEIYAKALRRKAAASGETVLGDKADKKAAGKVPWYKRMFGAKKKEADNIPDQAVPEVAVGAGGAEKGDADAQVNVGTIINLMSVDAFKVSEISGYLHFLLSSAPTQLMVCVILLYQILGLSSIPGLIVMVLLLPVNIGFAFGFGRAQKKIMAATDQRIHTTNEILQNIRIIKYFAWEKRFSKVINEKRQAELKALRGKYIIWSFAVAVWNTVPVAITFFSFMVYTLIEKKPLYPSVAFTAISLFGILRVPLDQLGDMIAHVNESSVSIDRVEEFLNEEETEKYEQLAHENVDESGEETIGFENGCFSWASKQEIVAEGASPAFRLMDLDIKFAVGKLNIIAGPTGSGKTSLLMALLGEMSCITGKVHLPGGYSREDVRPDPETGLTETVAYCAQQAWLVNANIKDNILFAQPLDEKRYHDVVIACALERDFEILDHGDKTLVGEKGITLSGGQKQRISLARALYSNSRHVLLDDCLSAVDSHTAKWIFNNCVTGPLMTNRTCILVTHNLALSVPSAKHIVVMENGKIAIQGTPAKVVASGKLNEEIDLKGTPGRVSTLPSRVPSSVGDSEETMVEREQSHSHEEHGIEGIADPKKLKEAKPPPVNPLDEEKAEGGVKYEVMMLYLRSMGPWWFWVLAVVVFGVQQFAALVANIWIREWANQYDFSEQSIPLTAHNYLGNPASTHAINNAPGLRSFIPYFSDEYSLKNMVAPNAPEVDVKFYLAVYAVIGMGGMLVALFRDLWLFYGSLAASWTLHKQLLHNVTRAKFKFFDVTPLGQLMNRFSKDLESIDQEIAPLAVGVVGCALGILVTVGLISAITPGFLIFAVFITLIYFFLGNFYLRSSRDLKRIESVQRSPLFQQFGETLTGITTIRAYGDEKRFIRDNILRVDTYNRPFIFLWAANRWLSFRIDLIAALVAFFAGVLVIISIGKIDAGSAGLSLGYAIGFAENTLWLVRLYSAWEQNMNSVERVKAYLDVEQEADAENEKTQPAKNWPSQGSVEFINYTTRYREDLDPVLKGVTFRINPLEKVGIVGRTGAGKSSLALALFRGLEAEDGKILVDGVDIGLIGLRDLRENITIVPQDPTLFTGTIRTNLDPFSVFTDEEVFTALRRVQLISAADTATQTPAASRPATPKPVKDLIAQKVNGAAKANGNGASNDAVIDVISSGASTPVSTSNKNIFLNLNSPVAESGNNLSQGQRQLLCLARALLKNPKVLMMDEATASIDYNTDNKIQETIRELESTIITIAHRLQTIVDYDKVLVLDKGEVVEFGHPHELLKKDDGVFRSMCETSGELVSLKKAARKAWNKNQLVDVESEEETYAEAAKKAGSSKEGSPKGDYKKEVKKDEKKNGKKGGKKSKK